jgi:hypothetical protein
MAFRFNRAGTTAIEKHKAAYTAETTKGINSLVARCQYRHFIPEGLSHFAFRRLSEKQKKTKALRALRLCGEQVFIKTLLGVVID